MNSNRKVMLPNNNKKNNHHTLFITLIIALFVLLVVALSKARSYGSELGFNESEVSGNEENYDEITESLEEDSETGTEISFSETDKTDFQISEDLLRDNIVTEEIVSEQNEGAALLGAAPESGNGLIVIEAQLYSGHRVISTSSNETGYEISIHSSSSLHYVVLSANITYTIYKSGGDLYVKHSDTLSGSHQAVYPFSGLTITPTGNWTLVVTGSSTEMYVTYVDPNYGGGGSGDEPDPNDPSANDPSGNDPSGNNPSGGEIELDGDLQGYLINYFGHKDYTVYDSEEMFKEKKFFVSRYEYEVLKSLDDIKILLLCNVGILIVILFVGRRKRNAGS